MLDSSRGWVNLADLLDYGFLLPNIRNSASPSKLLFNYAEVSIRTTTSTLLGCGPRGTLTIMLLCVQIHGNVSVQEIRAFLEALDEDEAIAVVDAMLERRALAGSSHTK